MDGDYIMTKQWIQVSFGGGATALDFENTVSDFRVHAGSTLLRTLIWVGWDVTWNGVDLSDEPLLQPVGWYFVEGNSVRHPSTSHPGISPWGDETLEVIATGYDQWHYAPAYTSRHISGTLSLGITGDFTVDEPVTPNQTVYAYGKSYVDSKAQRLFNGTGYFHFALGYFAGIAFASTPTLNCWGVARMLVNS